MKTFTVTRTLFGFPLTAAVSVLNDGVHVLLTGGCRTHVGAVTAVYGGKPETVCFPGHKDDVISKMWAESLADYLAESGLTVSSPEPGAAVTVACGIHYDGVSKEQIRAIVSVCADMLREVKETIAHKMRV